WKRRWWNGTTIPSIASISRDGPNGELGSIAAKRRIRPASALRSSRSPRPTRRSSPGALIRRSIGDAQSPVLGLADAQSAGLPFVVRERERAAADGSVAI